MISPERVTSVSEVPRGTCTGTLIPDNSVTSRPPTSTTAAPSCYDNWNERKCARLKNRNKCERNNVQTNCRRTCESCGNNDSGIMLIPIYSSALFSRNISEIFKYFIIGHYISIR